MIDLTKVITVQEASSMANIDDGYVRRMLIADKFKDLNRGIDYVKGGKTWLINKDSWISHLENIQINKKNKIDKT